MWISIISLFPKMFNAIIDYGITSKAIKKGLLKVKIWNPRDFSKKKNHRVDDRPYGGGPGMIMTLQPLVDAIDAAKTYLNINIYEKIKVIYLSPQGRKLDQIGVIELAKYKKMILVCGRYEGIDERFIQSYVDEEWSIGDYVLNGGELPAMVLIESISRFIPMVLGNQESIIEDSFSQNYGLLEYPHYTRPKIFKENKVPEILLSGNHIEIYRWRLKQSLGKTWLKRPDLLEKKNLNKEQLKLLLDFIKEYN